MRKRRKMEVEEQWVVITVMENTKGVVKNDNKKETRKRKLEKRRRSGS